MLVAILLGLVGGLTYTLIILNPGFRFSKLGIDVRDFLVAAAVNAFLGAVAGFIGWALSAGEVVAPKSYALYLLCGVGGGSLIQSWALAIANKQSQATLDRALQAVELMSRAQGPPVGDELGNLSRSLRSTTDFREQQQIAREMVELATKVVAQSGR